MENAVNEKWWTKKSEQSVGHAMWIHFEQLLPRPVFINFSCSALCVWIPKSSTIRQQFMSFISFHSFRLNCYIYLFIYYIFFALSAFVVRRVSAVASYCGWAPFCQHPQCRPFVCLDLVSLCKWNGIKWNVQFIVFRGFRIAMRHTP